MKYSLKQSSYQMIHHLAKRKYGGQLESFCLLYFFLVLLFLFIYLFKSILGDDNGLKAAFQRAWWNTAWFLKKVNAPLLKRKWQHQSGKKKTCSLSVIQDVHLCFLSEMDLQALQYYKMGLPCVWMLKDSNIQIEPQLQDQHLLRKLSPVDIIAIKAKYTNSVILKSSGTNLNQCLTRQR